MPSILNHTEAHLCVPIMGKGTQNRVVQKVVEGHLIEEVIEEQYPKCVETVVLEPTLPGYSPEPTKVTKAQLKEIQEFPTFKKWVESRAVSVLEG